MKFMEKLILPKSYYLAHPVRSRRSIRSWEIGFEERTGIKLLNPFYDVPRQDIEDLDNNVVNPRKKEPEVLVQDDLRGVWDQKVC